MKRLTISVLFLAGFAASIAEAKTCKEVASCEEAVKIWCDGCRRADADKDGIPCENICHTRDQVEEIQSRIGC